ncbi:response regulator transcription factor [Robertmurraya andreesenii]|uniref:DNA-binding NarL/FixJ family response regulator n=1 Tax=Anoxybacillus andreesenii TaxID=1325932 RepID=A0ABT9V5S3_9BACL|nr:response regulator transcription factor [Robertmurraya andreesenii]MDQ0156272.1 DNA-binding NarL/FixJ family response regulator [Robertmurraya andreesenii]
MKEKISILIADDQPIIRDGLATILSLEEDMEIVGKANDGKEAVELARLTNPSILLIDIRMPVMNGIEAVREIKRFLPELPVVMLTTFSEQEYIIDALKAGASGYLLKDMDTDQLISSIRSFVSGHIIFPVGIKDFLMNHSSTASDGTPTSEGKSIFLLLEQKGISFSEREKELLDLVLMGKTNEDISKEFYLSVGTIKNYLGAIYKKIGINSRSELMAYIYSLLKEHDFLK